MAACLNCRHAIGVASSSDALLLALTRWAWVPATQSALRHALFCDGVVNHAAQRHPAVYRYQYW